MKRPQTLSFCTFLALFFLIGVHTWSVLEYRVQGAAQEYRVQGAAQKYRVHTDTPALSGNYSFYT